MMYANSLSHNRTDNRPCMARTYAPTTTERHIVIDMERHGDMLGHEKKNENDLVIFHLFKDDSIDTGGTACKREKQKEREISISNQTSNCEFNNTIGLEKENQEYRKKPERQ
jgi:hypothetical protein